MAQTLKAVFLYGDQTQIDYTPSGAVGAGDVVDLGTWIGIATEPIAAAALGSLAVTGIFRGLKFTGEAIAYGATVYWDAGTGTFTGTIGYSEATAGKCVSDGGAAAGDATVDVLLTPGSA